MEFFIAGEFTSVVVDDYIPVKNGKPIFCRTQENELWAILLEKAFAKLHGNYGATEGGKSGMALHILTGQPSYDLLHENLDQDKESHELNIEELWERFLKFDRRGYSIGCGTAGFDCKEIEDSGILGGHAYTLISAHEIK